MEFKDRLQKFRKERNMTQEELAASLDVSRQAVAKWESGQAYPDIRDLVHISEILCVTLDSLLKENAECSGRMSNNESVFGSLPHGNKNGGLSRIITFFHPGKLVVISK